MKKKLCLAVLAIFLAAGSLLADAGLKIVIMEIPGDPVLAKNKLLANLQQLQALVDEWAVETVAADIQLLNMQDVILADLGSLKKGRIKWNHKIFQDKFLAVEFAPADYAALCEKIKNKVLRPGCQLAICDGKTKTVLKSAEVTFCDFADLAVQLNYPVKASPGQQLRQEVTVIIENKGSAAAKNFNLDILLSRDSKIPLQPAVVSENFSDCVRLAEGRETIPLLESGQAISVNFSGALKLPDDTPPGKYYLAVVVDPENQISEISKDNNIDSGYILIQVAEPKAFSLEMPETVLKFEPANYGFKIEYQNTILSDGKDWKLCKMKSNLYQIKHVSWPDFFWEIDTFEKMVWEVRGVDFCKKGGKAKDLDIKVEVKGGSLLVAPAFFTLKLAQTQLRFEPASKKFTLQAYGKPIFHLPFWWGCRREAHLYQIRYILWESFHWQVDTFKKQVSQISGGKFCSNEGSANILPTKVIVEQ